MTPEIMTATVVAALRWIGAVEKCKGWESYKVDVDNEEEGFLVRIELRSSRKALGWVRVLRDGTRAYAPALAEVDAPVRSIVEHAFNPSFHRAADVQLIRLHLAPPYRASSHPGTGALAAVRRDRDDAVPTWTLPPERLACSLFEQASPMTSAALEALLDDLQSDAPVDLRGYDLADARWQHAQAVNYELERLGVTKFCADPGREGAIERVPIFYSTDGKVEVMPSWRIHYEPLLAELRALKMASPGAVEAVFDRIGGKVMGLSDWRPW